MKITRDPDSGEIEQSCEPLSVYSVWEALLFAVEREQEFLGKSHVWWQEQILSLAQEIADEADPEEYEIFDIWTLERRYASHKNTLPV